MGGVETEKVLLGQIKVFIWHFTDKTNSVKNNYREEAKIKDHLDTLWAVEIIRKHRMGE